MNRRYHTVALAFGVLLLAAKATAEENWPQWRGPNQNGVSDAKDLPDTWSETDGIVWKTDLPSWSGSSPVIWQDRVFVTSPSKSDIDLPTAERDPFLNPGGNRLLLLCLSKDDGRILWERELDSGNSLNRKQNNTSPTPVTDGKHVWALTGTGMVTALTTDGEMVWTKNLQKDYGQFGLMFGYASSPLLHDGKLIVQVLHGYQTDDPSYIVAFDASTGNVHWRVERPTDALKETPDAYNTPALLRDKSNVQIVVCGGGFVSGHDPSTGNEIWRAYGLDPKNDDHYRTIASAVVVDGMVYAPTRQRPLLAFRSGGTGDVSTSHLAWQWDKPYGPDVPTPACDGQRFYMVDDKGVATCLDAKTGEVIWGPEHTGKGAVSASPLVADGKVYITNEAGVTTVLSAGPEYQVIATNTLPGEGHTLSSMAVSGNQLFLRTPGSLYCIGRQQK